MKQVEKKAVFFDIDGTLLEVTAGHKSLTPAVRQAILELRMAGHHTFIASGRPLAYIDPELTQSSLFDAHRKRMVIARGSFVQPFVGVDFAKGDIRAIEVAVAGVIEFFVDTFG